jgi:hypothetical protein
MKGGSGKRAIRGLGCKQNLIHEMVFIIEILLPASKSTALNISKIIAARPCFSRIVALDIESSGDTATDIIWFIFSASLFK